MIKQFKVSKPVKVVMDSSIGSGITEINRNSSWKNPENDFIKGIMKSPYIQLIQYLNNRL